MLFGCSSQSPNFNEYSSDVQSNKCHLKSIEVALPKGFVGCGNTTKFCDSQQYPGICILIGEDCDAEDDIAKNLELFRGTDFYRNRIRFEYSVDNEENSEYVAGVLKNDRLNTDLYFSGYFMMELCFVMFFSNKSRYCFFSSKFLLKSICFFNISFFTVIIFS